MDRSVGKQMMRPPLQTADIRGSGPPHESCPSLAPLTSPILIIISTDAIRSSVFDGRHYLKHLERTLERKRMRDRWRNAKIDRQHSQYVCRKVKTVLTLNKFKNCFNKFSVLFVYQMITSLMAYMCENKSHASRLKRVYDRFVYLLT